MLDPEGLSEGFWHKALRYRDLVKPTSSENASDIPRVLAVAYDPRSYIDFTLSTEVKKLFTSFRHVSKGLSDPCLPHHRPGQLGDCRVRTQRPRGAVLRFRT